jgi:transcriptional regulator with PAS, ATPase and Fis domain
MNRRSTHKTKANVTTIVEGLSKLAQAYQDRNVSVTSITLKRGKEIYEHSIAQAEPSAKLCEIKGRFENAIVTVSCDSLMPADVNADLQSLTTWAASASLNWTQPATHLTLVKQALRPLTKMLGASKQMQELTSDIDCAARSPHVVLILGESGTGKTTAASMIHQRSPRTAKPFVDINCAAIPDSLIESELFGYEKGAFTGAFGSKKGLFELADQGTLLLDEIGELKFELQAKLLTAIEQQKFRRLGGTVDIKCNVRIIVASSRDLQRMVIEGKFREDLYYRLAVLEISIPPLRDRREDIPILVHDRLIREQQRSTILGAVEIEDAAVKELAAYHWPGNIRQLHNVIARLTTRAEKDTPIKASSARKEIARFNHGSNKPLTRNDQSILLPADCRMLMPDESLHQYTLRVKRNVIETVRSCVGTMKATSVRLDVERSALSKLLSRLSDNKITISDEERRSIPS